MPFQRSWIFSINPMLSVTNGWYRLAIRVSTFHIDRLSTRTAQPLYEAMLQSYQPKHDALIVAYKRWREQGNSQLGQTLDLNNLLMLLSSTKIARWDNAIQVQFDTKTSTYKTLLPHRRAPFQGGQQEEILSAVEVLGTAAKDHPELGGLSGEILDFYALLKAAFDTQKEGIGNTSLSSQEVEKARVEMCVAQFANLGGIIQANPADSDAICYFFDQLALREGTQVLYTGSSKPSKAKNILVHTFAPGDHLKLEVESGGEQWFYLASKKDGMPEGGAVIKVAGGEVKTVAAEELGDLTHRYLMVYNPNSEGKGEWVVEFV